MAAPSSVSVFAFSCASSIVLLWLLTRKASRESSLRPSKISTQLYGPEKERHAAMRLSKAAARAE